MDKDPNNSSVNNEEEFQFTEEEQSGHELPSQKPPKMEGGGDESARRKKMWMIVIGIIVAIFCIYKLYGLFTATSSRALKEPLSTKTTLARVEDVKPENVQSEAAKTEVAKPEVSKLEEIKPAKLETESPIDLKAKEQKELPDNSVLTEKVTSLQSSQGNLQNQIAGLSSAITEIQNNISMLTQQMGQMVEQKNKTQTESKTKTEIKTETKSPGVTKESNQGMTTITTSNCEKIAEKKHHRQKMIFANFRHHKTIYTTYYIRSLIQGRAWLISPGGATLTVAVGDYLSGYGKITTIDTDEGVVTTSSGKVIRFMPQDR